MTETLLDWNGLLRRVGDDRPLAAELARIFVERSPDLLLELNEAAAGKDSTALLRAAHGLKGALAVFGAAAAVALAQRLESFAAGGGNEPAPADLAELSALTRQLESELTAQLALGR